MDLLSDLISLESVEPAMDNDLNFIEPSLNPVSATVSTIHILFLLFLLQFLVYVCLYERK